MLLLGVLLGGLKAALVARRMGWWRLKNGASKAQKRPELIYLINSGR